MKDVRRIDPREAYALVTKSGYTYIDVRSEMEFILGHPPGAVNVPLMLVSGDQLADNPDFLDAMTRRFSLEAALLIGCHSGSRSRRAARLLQQAGYRDLVELRTGFDGCRDAFGRLEPGWARIGLPVEDGAGAPEC